MLFCLDRMKHKKKKKLSRSRKGLEINMKMYINPVCSNGIATSSLLASPTSIPTTFLFHYLSSITYQN